MNEGLEENTQTEAWGKIMENTVKRMRDRKKKHHKPYTTSTSSLRM